MSWFSRKMKDKPKKESEESVPAIFTITKHDWTGKNKLSRFVIKAVLRSDFTDYGTIPCGCHAPVLMKFNNFHHLTEYSREFDTVYTCTVCGKQFIEDTRDDLVKIIRCVMPHEMKQLRTQMRAEEGRIWKDRIAYVNDSYSYKRKHFNSRRVIGRRKQYRD